MNATHEELRKRVQLLERRLRLVALAVAVCVIALGTVGVSAFRGQDKPAQLLRASRIEVVNDKGEVVAVIDGSSTTLRVGPEDDAHVTITAERGSVRSAEQPARTAKASIRVSNPRPRLSRESIGEGVEASLCIDGSHASVLLGYWESSKSEPNLVWLAANSQNTWVRLEHGSGSRASLFAYDFGVSGLRVGKANPAGQAIPPSATLEVVSAGPILTMFNNDGDLIYYAGAPKPGRDGK